MPTSKIKVAIMASGSGTNAENLLSYALENKKYSVVAVVTDQNDAGVIHRTEKFGVDCFVVPLRKQNPSETYQLAKQRQENKIIKILYDRDVEWVLLAGYMRILSPNFIQNFWDNSLGKSKIINIHPALLPQFPGVNAYKQAWDARVEKSGVTVHHVDAGIDSGPIILQETFPRNEDDDFDSFKSRGMKLEYQLYKKALDKLFEGELP